MRVIAFRLVSRVAAAEILLYLGGQLVFPGPHALLFAGFGALFILIADELLKPEARAAIIRGLGATFPHDSPTVHGHWSIALVLALAITSVVALPLWGSLERRLWKTGTYGEPPWNRTIAVSQRFDSSSQEYVMTAEFHVRAVPLGDNLRLAILTDPISPVSSGSNYRARAGAPLKSLPGGIEDRLGWTFRAHGGFPWLDTRATLDVGRVLLVPAGTAITPKTSIVIQLRAPKKMLFVDAQFSRGIDDPRTCGNGVECIIPPDLVSPEQERWRYLLVDRINADAGLRDE